MFVSMHNISYIYIDSSTLFYNNPSTICLLCFFLKKQHYGTSSDILKDLSIFAKWSITDCTITRSRDFIVMSAYLKMSKH